MIELLVVISIIALLVAILMPALNSARQQATGAVCLANCKSLSLAWNMYQDDNEGQIIMGHTDDWNGFKPWVYYSNSVAAAGQPSLEPKFDAIRRGLLYKYTQSVEVYNCPGDKRSLKPSAATSDSPALLGGYRSYSIPGGLFGVDTAGAWGIVPITKMSEIKTPSEKYAFIEEMDGRGDNMGSWVVYPLGSHTTNSWIDPIAIWHNKQSTLGFCDGHAEMHKWVEQSTLDMALSQSFYQTLYSGEDGTDLQYMKRGYAFRSLY